MKKLLLIPIATGLLLFSYCSPMKISVSENLVASPELPVKGRNGILINQKLSFGEFKTTKVNRSWTEGSEINGGDMKVLWVTQSSKHQRIHFSLIDESTNTSEVFCVAKTSSEDWTLGKNPNSLVNIMGEVLGFDGSNENNYAVNIYLPKEPAPWEMRLDIEASQRNSKKYVGFLVKNKDNYYTVHPVTAVQNKNGKKGFLPFGSIGFEIKNKDGVAVAAVSMIDNGIVYLNAVDAKEKFLLANACAALLLHQTLN